MLSSLGENLHGFEGLISLGKMGYYGRCLALCQSHGCSNYVRRRSEHAFFFSSLAFYFLLFLGGLVEVIIGHSYI